MDQYLKYVKSRMGKKRNIDVQNSSDQTSLKRCLNTYQLTFVGIGSMIGSGIYVLIGVVTKENAGPSVIFSFVLATISAIMTSFCFAEYGCRIPKSGNAYLYIYASFGELLGFITGWSFVVGYLLSGALAARAWSGYMNSLLGNLIQNYTGNLIQGWEGGLLIADHPDFIAPITVVVFTLIALCGVQCSTSVTSVLAFTNCVVLAIFSIIGFISGSAENWFNDDHGGFFPFGISGVMQGTAASFFAYFGYENICIAAEESKNYAKSVPRALIASIIIAAILYLSVAVSFTLLVPYWEIDINAPIADALLRSSYPKFHYIVYVGSLCGFSNILLVNGYVISRLLFSLGEEGLMWKGLAVVSNFSRVPIFSLILTCIIEGLCAFFIRLEHLFKFYVIVAISSYAMISFGIVKLHLGNKIIKDRYSKDISKANDAEEYNDGDFSRSMLPREPELHSSLGDKNGPPDDLSPINHPHESGSSRLLFKDQDRSSVYKSPLSFLKLGRFISWISRKLYRSSVDRLLVIISTLAAILAAVVMCFRSESQVLNVIFVFICVILISSIFFCTRVLSAMEQNPRESRFTVPLIPYFPVLSGVINIFFLIAALDRVNVVGYLLVISSGFIFYMITCLYDYKRS